MIGIILPRSINFRTARAMAIARKLTLLMDDTGRFLITNMAPNKKWHFVYPIRLDEFERSALYIDSCMEKPSSITLTTSCSTYA
jgi:hypothetical protein